MWKIFRRFSKYEPIISLAKSVWDFIAGGWVGFVAILTSSGAMTWLVSQWDAVSQQGWGAVGFVGIMGACVLCLAISASLVAWRKFRPIPTPAVDPSPLPTQTHNNEAAPSPFPDKPDEATVRAKRIYVGRMPMAFPRDGLGIEIGILGYNGNSSELRIDRAEGSVKLSIPQINSAMIGLLSARMAIELETILRPHSEFLVALTLDIPSAAHDAVAAARKHNNIIQIDFDEFKLFVCEPNRPHSRFALPLWDGLSYLECGASTTNRVTKATGLASITVKTGLGL